MRKHVCFALSLPAVLLALACGGASTTPGPVSAPASVGLAYVNPTGTGWNLVRDESASTDTHLVLDLVGPAGSYGRGVGFNLQSDGTVNFARLGTAGYIQDTGVFQLQSTFTNYPVEPVLLAGGLKNHGTLLTAGIFQKDRYQPSQPLGKPVCRIAIDFDAVATAALAIPDYIGDMPTDATNPDWSSVAYNYPASLVPVQISVGTLKTK